jgi:DNA polymerase V
VLSNNDGCAWQEAKKQRLRYKDGVPVFQIQDLIKQHNIQVLSSNFSYMVKCPTLYGAAWGCTRRARSPLIDECFLKLTAYEHLFDLTEYAQDMRAKAFVG